MKLVFSRRYIICLLLLFGCVTTAQTNVDSTKSGERENLFIEDTTNFYFLKEVEIISTKYEIKAQNVSIPIEISDAQEIFSSSGSTPSDILKNEPGLSLSRDGIWGTNVTIRGLSKNNIVAMIDGNRVETATDLAASLSLIETNDINRIEVIKTAASSLYGSGALSGIVNIITEKGFYPEAFQINGTILSSHNSVNKNSSGTLGCNIGNINWFLHLRGSLRNADDTKTPDGLLNNSQFRNKNYSLSSGYKFSGNQEIKISYQDYIAKDVGIPGAKLLFPTDAEIKYLKAERKLSSFEYNLRNPSRSFAKFQAKIFYQEIDRDVENVPNQTNFSNDRTTKTSVLKITPTGNHKTIGASLQADWLIGKKHFLIAGFEAWQRELKTEREKELFIEMIDTNTQAGVNTVYKILGEKPLPNSRFRSIGFFGQDEFTVIEDKLKLIFGGRIDHIQVKNDEAYNPVYEIINGQLNNNPAKQKIIWENKEAEDFSWSSNISFLYSLNDVIDLTFTASRSFRSPSLEERYQYIDLGNLVKIGNPDLEPEKGYFLDAGLRIWQNDFTFSGNLFLNLLSDLVSEVPGTFEGRSALIKTNIGKARLYGFDLGFDYNFFKYYSLSGNLAYVNGEDKENNTYLSQIPPLNGRFIVGVNPISLFQIKIAANFSADQNKVAKGEIRTPGYITYDLQMISLPFKFDTSSLQIAAGVENITNKSYRNHLATNRGLITSEPGRNYYIKLRFDW